MPEKDNPSYKQPSFVVGIGASAGGLEAIERLFDRMPTDTGMAFVVVQHLSPDFKSLMNEVLGRWTSLPIYRVKNEMTVEADSIYLIPPKKEMVISDGKLLLTDKDPDASLTLPIDHFFRSLGQDCGRQAIAIVLSGTGSDGSRGIIDVHEAGGLVISQSESTAKFDGMPRSARESGATDLHLAPEEMPDALTRYLQDPRISAASEALDNSSLNETGLKQVFTLIRDGYGLDFSHYKLNTVVRRTERRLVLSKIRHIDDYVQLLKQDHEELDRLYKDLLIGVTRFFRDDDAFQKLATTTVKKIVERTAEDSEIRVWVAGCATGEEAYSLAILFDEAISASNKHLFLKIFATDVHKESLEFAGLGIYPETSFAEMEPKRISKYFVQNGEGYQVSQELRQKIVFAPHNLVKDAPFTKIDLISCRNLLIYLQPQTQRKILSLFHFGLRTGGFLFLGPSESPGEVVDEFEAIDGHWKIFCKRRDVRLPQDMRMQLSPLSTVSPPPILPKTGTPPALGDSLAMSTYDALLELVMPPSLLVSEDGQLLHTFGDAGQFLQSEHGRHTAEIRDRLLADLRLPVLTAIGKVLKSNKPISYSGVALQRDDGETLHYDVTAQPVQDPRHLTRTILVQIEQLEYTLSESTENLSIDAGELSTEQIFALETELRYTKENLQSTIEELETSNEELQATNEELVASNEELQSTNEELHSVNEELYTVNAEHQNKITELSELTRDIDNLLQSTEVDTVFLDAELRIRKFTSRVAKLFNFLPQDIGRRIDSFTHTIDCGDLPQIIANVISTSKAYEAEVCEDTGRWLLMRVLPYRTTTAANAETEVAGALLTFFDITKLREASKALEDSVRQRDSFLAMLSHELRNPLATIVNATHLLSRPTESGNLTEPIEVIQRQSRQMATLLDDLLDVTRVSLGKIQLQKRPFDLLRVVDGAIESVQARRQAREQEITTSFAPGPIWVYGSEPRVLQVISNLLTNASKYSSRGAEIELQVSVTNDNQAVIRVRDSGVGISPQQIDKVFDLFVQSDRTIDRADGGLGVGLTLVKSLVELHDGRVTVQSEGEGKGSEFCVYLPTCEAPPQISDTPATEPTEIYQLHRLVLVEDNVDASKMLAFLLEESGYEVSISHDGLQGLEMIRSLRPDAAIVDVGLPGLNGYDLARAVREEQTLNGMFLIALTGYGQTSDREEALAAGFDEHLVKPVDPESLYQLLAQTTIDSSTTSHDANSGLSGPHFLTKRTSSTQGQES